MSNKIRAIILGAVVLIVIGAFFMPTVTCVAMEHHGQVIWFFNSEDLAECVHKLDALGYVIDTTGYEGGLHFVEFHWPSPYQTQP